MRVYRSLSAAAIALSIFAKSAVAQSSANLTHVVSVTVPARVRVNLAQIQQPAVTLSNTATVANGVSLRIDASRGWVVSIERASSHSSSKLQWSNGTGPFAPLGYTAVPVIAGDHSTKFTMTNVVVRVSAADTNGEQNALLLTIAAP